MTVRRYNKPDKTGISAQISAESRCHSPGCMAMQSGEIYQARNSRFVGEFTAGFTGLTPHSRRTCPGRCRKEMLCSIIF
ncbi:hypothetical protein FRA07_11295 [Klebsiella quasipneumoniae subsp. similipneumoniae]|jgi:hypothetical protein|nr:hypothetical protein FRA07_11295 [Klebsiella quasipneumoniae subsp. similipneumoniae]